MKYLFTLILVLFSLISFSQEDNFQQTESGDFFWQKTFNGSKEEALEAIYTNLTIRNNVITELENKIFFDFESSFIFNPNAVLTGFVKLRAKIRVEFKSNQYRVTIMKMQDIRSAGQFGELAVDFQTYSEQQKRNFEKAKETLNREFPNLFENISSQGYNSTW